MTLKTTGGRRSFRDRWFKGVKGTIVNQKFGIKTLFEPANAIIDIVFVHGITGHRDHTWAVSNELPWPQTLLPFRTPEARILTFGYDASVIGWGAGISGNSIGDHSKNLLSALATHRASDSSDRRPIVFVAHSLGGLVVKDTLLSSRTTPESHLQVIGDCVWGILFLGTPHAGVDLAVLGERLARVAGLVARTNSKVVEVLRRDSEVLSRVQNDFQSLLRTRPYEGHPPIRITCFYEELPLLGVGVIVPKDSAIMPGYTAIGIHHNHQDMARLSSADDPGFVSIAGELRRWVDEIVLLDEMHEADKDFGNQLPIVAKQGSLGSPGGITIWGSVQNSVVVSGSQTIEGDLTFGS